jgi:hypothetical protein
MKQSGTELQKLGSFKSNEASEAAQRSDAQKLFLLGANYLTNLKHTTNQLQSSLNY